MKYFTKRAICILSLLLVFTCKAQVKEKPIVTDLLNKPFYMGVYVYDYQFSALSKEQNMDYYAFLEKHLKILKQHGVNSLHLTVTGTREKEFSKTLELLGRYDMKVIVQLDFAYFNGKWTEESMIMYAKKAGDFIQKYINNPQILGWSVKEEVRHSEINKLSKYYFMIREHAPNANFTIVHSNLGAAKDQPVPDPEIMGTDRYAFWWEFSGGGYLASPASALSWLRTQAVAYYKETAKRGADFLFVTTTCGYFMPADKWVDVKKMSYPKTKEGKKELSKKSIRFAEEGRMGWVKVDSKSGSHYGVWKYYRMPKNCMRASAWSAVLEGARLFFCWAYIPQNKKMLTMDAKKATLNLNLRNSETERILWSLAGRPGEPNPELKEFGLVSKEIRPYGKIITKMHKLSTSPLACKTKNFFNRAFSFPGLRGKVIVLHNGNVGTWPYNSRYHFKDNDQIFIDDKGNLVGYKPFTEPAKVHINWKSFEDKWSKAKGTKLYDIKTGQPVPTDKSGYYVSILPGSGILLFLGIAEEAKILHGLYTEGHNDKRK